MDAPKPQPQPQALKKEFAWQPLTFRGTGKFAAARTGRLWLIQFLFSLVTAVATMWFVEVDCFPVVVKATKNLPAASEIRGSQLDWRAEPAVLLAENRFLAIAIDVKHSGAVRSPASFSVELGQNDYKVFSLLGYIQLRYPRGWIISLAREEAIPWWGAWSPVLLAFFGATAIGIIFFLWTILSTVYFLPAWLIGFLANRELSFGASWRLVGAAQLPAALWLSASIFAFGLAWFGLVGLALLFSIHLLIGWVYIVGSILKLPGATETADARHNPFATKTPDAAQIAKVETENPFDTRHDQSPAAETTPSAPLPGRTDKPADDPLRS